MNLLGIDLNHVNLLPNLIDLSPRWQGVDVQFGPLLLVSIKPGGNFLTAITICLWMSASDQERTADVTLKF